MNKIYYTGGWSLNNDLKVCFVEFSKIQKKTSVPQ